MKPGKAIRTIRAARSLTQRSLAKKAGLDPSYVSLLERDQRDPTLKTLVEVSRALEVPLYLLILLASEADELKGVSEEQAQSLGRELLTILIAGSEFR